MTGILFPYTWPIAYPLHFAARRAELVYEISEVYRTPHGHERRRVESLYRTPCRRFVLVTENGHAASARRLFRWVAKSWLRATDAPLEVHQKFFPGSVKEA